MTTNWPFTTINTAANAVWGHWINTTNGTVGSSLVWENWVTAGTGSQLNQPYDQAQRYWNAQQYQRPPAADVQPATDDLVAPQTTSRSRRRMLIRQNRSRAHSLRTKAASRRARDLLLEHLSDEQREEFLESRSFHVVTAGGARRYQITYGYAGNIRLVEAVEPGLDRHGRPLRAGAEFCMHCYHPDGAIPSEDHMLAQKFMIETAEEEFLRLANVTMMWGR